MNDDNRRAATAREHDDSDIIQRMDEAPSHGDRSGHKVGHDVGTRDELEQAVGGGGATRVRNSDKKEDEGLPRFNQK